MSLYDDVEDDSGLKTEKQNDIVSNWNNNNNFKLLEAQLQAKKYQQQLNTLKREKPTIAPVIDLSGDKRRKITENIIPLVSVKINESTQKIIETNENPVISDDIQVQSIYSASEEEYDPLKPNDYEKLVEDLKKRKLYVGPNQSSSEDTNKPLKTRGSHDSSHYSKNSSSNHHHGHAHAGSNGNSKKDSSFKPRYDDEDYEKDLPTAKRTSMGAAFAPPPSLIEESKKSDEEYESPFQNKFENTSKSAPSTPRSAVEKMMEKMGYKEGEGLGRNKQGMSVALQVEKTGKRSGRIIHEKDVQKDTVAPATEPMKNPSKVVLLRNMVGPGEVDGELEGETKEECQKYGEVSKVVIFEIPDTTPDEAVRIFIEFKTLPAAIKALVDLNGRYFGGRVVKATFYNLDKFRSYNLADEP